MRHRRNSDAEIRATERAVRADRSDIGAYVKALRHKLRAGILSYERLVMAARLGHPAARVAAPEWVERGEINWSLWGNRQRAIRELGYRSEIVSYACDCAERVLDVFERLSPGDTRPRIAIEVARVCAIDHQLKNRRAAAEAASAADSARTNFLDRVDVVVDATVAAARAAAANNVNVFLYANDAAYSASHVYDAVAFEAEQLWQQERLAQYLLGEVSLPPPHTKNPLADRGDMRLRALERAVAADPSDINAGARLIAARIRVGLTTPKRVLMAARIGDEAARLAAPEWVKHDVMDWDILGLRQEAINTLVNRREIVSLACDCAERVLDVFEQQYPNDMRPRETIEAARAWIINPTVKNTKSVREAANVFYRSGSGASNMSYYAAAAYAAHAVVVSTRGQAAYYAAQAASCAVYAASHVLDVDVEQIGVLRDEEHVWQQERLAQYLVGGVSMPPVGSNLK